MLSHENNNQLKNCHVVEGPFSQQPRRHSACVVVVAASFFMAMHEIGRYLTEKNGGIGLQEQKLESFQSMVRSLMATWCSSDVHTICCNCNWLVLNATGFLPYAPLHFSSPFENSYSSSDRSACTHHHTTSFRVAKPIQLFLYRGSRRYSNRLFAYLQGLTFFSWCCSRAYDAAGGRHWPDLARSVQFSNC